VILKKKKKEEEEEKGKKCSGECFQKIKIITDNKG